MELSKCCRLLTLSRVGGIEMIVSGIVNPWGYCLYSQQGFLMRNVACSSTFAGKDKRCGDRSFIVRPLCLGLSFCVMNFCNNADANHKS
ncbi:hypothetical protein Mapa_008708 [Marchantia paleacea]|nr:hypothetical protein Mapa_008708 [Marchantia paleacea]